MRSSRRILLVAAVLLLAGIACTSARRGDPLAGPLANLSPHEVSGEKAFMQLCSQCHPGGEAGLGPAINNKPLPAFLMKYQIRHGLGAMPSFDKQQISGAVLDDIIAYIKTLRSHG